MLISGWCLNIDLWQHTWNSCHVTPLAYCRMHMRTPSQKGAVWHPVQLYEKRPVELEHVSFEEYYREYTIDKRKPNLVAAKEGKTWKPPRNFIGYDAAQNPILKQRQIIRFSNFHPGHQLQNFFYTLLLRNSGPFRNENQELLSRGNTCYFQECINKRIIASEDDINREIEKYAAYQMLASTDITDIVGSLCDLVEEENGSLKVKELPEHQQNVSVEELIKSSVEQIGQRQLAFLPDLSHIHFNDEQQAAIEVLSNPATKGIHVLSGTPGSGKTLCTKFIARKILESQRKVMLSATTGSAASQLAATANTVHSAFSISQTGQYMTPLFETDSLFHQLQAASVIIIDEMSMLTQYLFSQVLSRIQEVCGPEFLQSKLLILVGDHAQLPPVCHHNIDRRLICRNCHLSSSVHWSTMQWHHLHVSVRQNQDPEFLQLLSKMRDTAITDEEIATVLGQCLVEDQAEQQRLMEQDITIICTHNRDVDKYNAKMLKLKFQPKANRGCGSLDKCNCSRPWPPRNQTVCWQRIKEPIACLCNGLPSDPESQS